MDPEAAGPPTLCAGFELVHFDPEYDVAVLQLEKDRLHSDFRDSAPYLALSSRVLEEGEPVYSFGYPLSRAVIHDKTPGITVGEIRYSPRTTSAIVASTVDVIGFMAVGGPPQHYVLDKALNYGNSGGPIVAQESGMVHALCSRFQPVPVRQDHLNTWVVIPSLYGVVCNLGHPRVFRALLAAGAEVAQ